MTTAADTLARAAYAAIGREASVEIELAGSRSAYILLRPAGHDADADEAQQLERIIERLSSGSVPDGTHVIATEMFQHASERRLAAWTVIGPARLAGLNADDARAVATTAGITGIITRGSDDAAWPL